MKQVSLNSFSTKDIENFTTEQKKIHQELYRRNTIIKYINKLIKNSKNKNSETIEPFEEYFVIESLPGKNILVFADGKIFLIKSEDGTPSTATEAIDIDIGDVVIDDFREMNRDDSFEYYDFSMWSIEI